MAEVPTINDSIDEPQAQVTDQLLGNPDSDKGDLLPNRPSFDLNEYQKHSLNPSTELTIGSALKLVMVNRCKLPAGTGKSYLLLDKANAVPMYGGL